MQQILVQSHKCKQLGGSREDLLMQKKTQHLCCSQTLKPMLCYILWVPAGMERSSVFLALSCNSTVQCNIHLHRGLWLCGSFFPFSPFTFLVKLISLALGIRSLTHLILAKSILVVPCTGVFSACAGSFKPTDGLQTPATRSGNSDCIVSGGQNFVLIFW